MNFARKQKLIYTIFIMVAFSLALSTTASAEFWKKKKDEKAKSETKKTKASTAKTAKIETTDTKSPVSPVPPQVVKLSPGLQATRASNVPVAPNIDLTTINATQQELDVLAARYEDLRHTHEEQLISLRALASQAKIHSQLLNDLKDKFATSQIGGTSMPAGLDASSLEKYRLIRERMTTQQKAISDITANQQRLQTALMATNLPNPPPAIKLTPAINTPMPSSVSAIKRASELGVVRNVAIIEDAQKRAAEQNEKMDKEKKEKKKK